MRSYDEIVENVIEATVQHRRRVKRIQQIASASVMCAVCVLGLSVYLNLEPQQTLPSPSETETQTTFASQSVGQPAETIPTSVSQETLPIVTDATDSSGIQTGAATQTEQNTAATRRPAESTQRVEHSEATGISSGKPTSERVTEPHRETSVIIPMTTPPVEYEPTEPPSIPDFNNTAPTPEGPDDTETGDGNEDPPAMETAPPDLTLEPTDDPSPYTTTTTTTTTSTTTTTTTTVSQAVAVQLSYTAESKWLSWAYPVTDYEQVTADAGNTAQNPQFPLV